MSSNLKISDHHDAPPTGELQLSVFRGGQLVERFVEKNLIVNGSKRAHARLLGGSFSGNSVTQVGFGTNGAAPVAGNSSLTNPTLKQVDSVTYPADNQVSFNFSLAATEGNGKQIMEFGLITESGALYARRIRATALNKESDISLSGSWIITF